MLPVREWWQSLRALPQVLLVQPERLGFDSAYAVALVPPVALALIFFRRNSLLLIALCILAGVVCVLSLQLARLTLGLPAWVGHKANHPLVSSLLIACFLSPETPAWVGVALVGLLVLLDTLVWPQLVRMLVHPALVVFAVLFAIKRYIPIGTLNPFDLRPLEDPLTLWYKLHLVVDPIKLYVGNVPGPMGATSVAALFLGVAYLWYTRKISFGLIFGFVIGVAAVALAHGEDLGLQLNSGPSLFVAGYLAADRRRILLPERFAFLLGAGGGALTVVLRTYGQGTDATWQGFLVLGLLGTLVLRLVTGTPVVAARPRGVGRSVSWKTLSIRSGPPKPAGPPEVPVSRLVREPVVAATPVTTHARMPANPARIRSIDSGLAPDEMVKQMRVQARRGPPKAPSRGLFVRILTLLLFNPVGLWLTWRSHSTQQTKWAISMASVVWYAVVALAALLVFAAGH